MKKYIKPKRFDRDIIVIGAGAGGLVSALIGVTVNARVSLIEKNKMGGDCLNTGCVPSKALLRSAKWLHQTKRAKEFGFKSANIEFDFADIMERVQRIIKKIEPHDSVERFTKLGVDCIQGEAKITSPFTVEVNGKTLTSRNIIIAAGAEPFVPPIPGIENINYLTSDNVWELRELPKRLIVLGGGPIGCELTQAFSRLGSEVTQIEMMPQLMSREDSEVSEYIAQKFRHEGVDIRLDHKAKHFLSKQNKKVLICEHNGEDIEIEFDQVLVAVGRSARIENYGLNDLEINITHKKTIEVNDFLQTNYPNIYAVGDVAGPYQFTHTAAHMAWYAAVNSLFGRFKKFRVDYSVIPWATYTDPEVARVGLNEREAKEKGIEYEVVKYEIDDLDRAITDEDAHGFVKVLTVPNKDKILGVTIMGEHAGDLIAEYVFAMKQNMGLKKILATIHIYPTLAEANKYAAGEWKRAHAPQWILQLLGKYFTWCRK